MTEEGLFGVFIAILLSTFRVSVPLVFASMGGIMSERAGVVNIALEGLMLVGAFAAATAATMTHSPWLGALVGMGAGVLLAAIYALFVIEARADQIVAGTAINLLAFGVTPLLAKSFFDTAGTTPALEMSDRFGSEPIYLALVTVLAIAYWFRHSRLALWLGFAGEHPEALSTAGIRVKPVRWFGVLAAGALAGLGGATLSIFLSSSFSRGMTAGRGFMALAALIFGKWKPIPTLFACLFFGLTDAVQIRLQGVAVFGDKPIPVQFIQILPYLFTVLVLAGFMGKSRPPRALGSPWVGVLAAFALLFTQGCEFRELGDLFSKSAETSGAASTSASNPSTSNSESLSRQNAELLAEMTRVTLLREPRNPGLFSDYLASLDQGASLEGILNGLLHSSEYREIESKSPVATEAARRFFVDEFFRLQVSLAEAGKKDPGVRPLRVGARMGQPLPRAVMPSGASENGEGASETTQGPAERVQSGTGRTQGTEANSFHEKSARLKYELVFRGSTLPVLKRVLFEALLARMEAAPSNATPDAALGSLYAETAARLASLGVDFGLPQRNRADAAFHLAWFTEVFQSSASRARDRVLWEFANRYFRVLNQLQSSDVSKKGVSS